MPAADDSMITTSTITTVLFDYSGVLTTALSLPEEPPFDPVEMMTFMAPALMGTEPHAWHQLERGEITIDQWIEIVEADVPGGAAMFDPASPLNAMAALVVRDDHIGLAGELDQAGYIVGVVTNNVAEWRPLWRERLPAETFATIIDSADVGMRKPEPAIYSLAMDRLGVTNPAEVLFIDDFEWNVTGAIDVGMVGLHCTPETDLRRELTQLGLLA